MPNLICVQCTEPVESLYLEYSESNIRLTRCKKCEEVVDKYVEYEVILVFIDAILHRKQAIRHILNNRWNKEVFNNLVRWVPLSVIVANCLLKIVVLRGSTYNNLSWMNIAHVVGCSALEHACLIGSFGSVAYYFPIASIKYSTTRYKVDYISFYITLILPEMLRMFAIILLVFDTEPSLLFLIGLLIISLQFTSVKCLMANNAIQWHPNKSNYCTQLHPLVIDRIVILSTIIGHVNRENIAYDDGVTEVPVTMIDMFINDNFCWNTTITINLNKSNNWLLFIDYLKELCSESFTRYNKLSDCYEIIYKLPVIGCKIFNPVIDSDPDESFIADNSNKVKKSNKEIAKYNSSQCFLWNSKYYDVNYIYSYNSELSNIFKVFGHTINPKIQFSGAKNITEIKQCNFYNCKHHKQIHCNINHDTPQVRSGWFQANELDYLEIKFLSPRLVTHIGTAGSYPTIDIFPKRRYIGKRKMRAYNAIKKDEKTSSYIKVIQNEGSLSWVTEYELYYKNFSTNKWILAGILIGNSDAMTEHVNDLYPYYNCRDGLLTQYIRIKPTNYHIRSCMRFSIYETHLPSHELKNEIDVNDINQSLVEYVIRNEDNHHSKGKCRDSLKRFMYYKDSYYQNQDYLHRCRRKSEFRNIIKESLN